MKNANQVQKNAKHKYNWWSIIDIDKDSNADIVLFGKQTRYGIKFAGVGHNGTKDASRFYLNDKAIRLKQRGFYGEVSGKLAEILLIKYNVPTIKNNKFIEKILKKTVTFHGEHPDGVTPGYGWYSRYIGNHEHIKILVGRPK